MQLFAELRSEPSQNLGAHIYIYIYIYISHVLDAYMYMHQPPLYNIMMEGGMRKQIVDSTVEICRHTWKEHKYHLSQNRSSKKTQQTLQLRSLCTN